MAEIKVTHEDVSAAEKALWGPVAEAQSWIEVYKLVQDSDPLATLANGIFERLTDAIDLYHHQLLRHGIPSVDERHPPPLES